MKSNKKGEVKTSGVGLFIIVFVALIVGLALIVPTAQNVGQSTQTLTFTNQSFTLPALNGIIVLNGQAANNVVVFNRSAAVYVLVPATNYTITNYDVSTGTLRTTLKLIDATFANNAANITYISEPIGYVTDSGSRSILTLIVIFTAIGILAIGLYQVRNNGLLDMFT